MYIYIVALTHSPSTKHKLLKKDMKFAKTSNQFASFGKTERLKEMYSLYIILILFYSHSLHICYGLLLSKLTQEFL